MYNIFLGIGTNLGEREDNISVAVSSIEKYIGRIVKSSSLFQTEPWGFEANNDFLNMVVKVETSLEPMVLIEQILSIETMLGRIRNGEQYSSRLIDIDLLLFENQVIDEKSLKVPHPLMQERNFVLIPLSEIAPDVVHPVFNVSISSLLFSSPDKSSVSVFRGA
jgi:2-amino-4-hydroxy-6-hydroxymethyldihydropteridine diphosphokinase